VSVLFQKEKREQKTLAIPFPPLLHFLSFHPFLIPGQLFRLSFLLEILLLSFLLEILLLLSFFRKTEHKKENQVTFFTKFQFLNGVETSREQKQESWTVHDPEKKKKKERRERENESAE